jgi:hypothetical protein
MAEHHKDEKKMTGLLRKAIVSASDAKQEGCPEPDLLAAYYEHSLNDSETARVEEHFANCSRCQEQLAVMVRAEPPQETAKARQWNWRLVRLWVTPLAVAAAMFILWIARPSLKTSNKKQPPVTEVAQLKPAPLSDAQSLPLNGRSVDQLKLTPGTAPRRKALDRASVSDLAKDKTQAKESLSRPKSTFANSPAAGGQVAGLAGAVSGRLSEKRSDDETRQSSAAPAAEMQRDARMAKSEASTSRGTAAAPAPAPPPTPTPQAAPAPAAPAPAATATAEITSSEKSADVINGAAARQFEADKKARQSANLSTLPQTTQSQKVMASHSTVDYRALQLIVYSPDVKVMWRVSGQGRVELSKDGGRNWQEQFVDAKQIFTAGHAPSTTVCWVVGHAGVVLLTADGTTWKVLPAPTSMDLVNVIAKDAKHAGVTASDGSMLKTKDGGKTWQTK